MFTYSWHVYISHGAYHQNVAVGFGWDIIIFTALALFFTILAVLKS